MSENTDSVNNTPSILILEDDVDQMDLLVNFTLSEIKKLTDDESTDSQRRKKIKNIRIIKVTNIKSLHKAVTLHKGILLAVLDCNAPDTRGSKAHDQLVKTNHVITGQHRSVDIVTEHLPEIPITMISSLNRFQHIVNRYYDSKHNLKIRFVSKNDQLKIRKSIEFHLRQYLGAAN